MFVSCTFAYFSVLQYEQCCSCIRLWITLVNLLFQLQLWDTAGQERFRKSMVQHDYRNVHVVVFVYDVTKISSFENMPHWIEECDNHHLTSENPKNPCWQ